MGILSKEHEKVKCKIGYTYRVTNKLVVDVELDISYTAYGIDAFDHTGNCVKSYPDVSTSEEFVTMIVDKCNCGELDILHLEDVLVDFIG